MSDNETEKVLKTPQGQFVTEAPQVSAPAAQHNLFGYGWGTWLGNPAERYGYLVSSRNVPISIKLEMLKDEVLALCVAFTGATLVKARREIQCADAKKQKFFAALFHSWEQEFVLQANVGVALGSLGLVKKWRFETPQPVDVNAPPVWPGAATPYIITGFDMLYPIGSEPRFDAKGREFQGVITPDGPLDVFYSLWLTFRQELAFGAYQGVGRLEACYKQWWLKNFGTDLYVVALQKQANRVVQASYPPGIDPKSGKSNQTIALEVGDSVRSGATVAIPSDTYTTLGLDGEERASTVQKWGLAFLEGAGSMQSFHEIDNHHDKKMAMGYFIPPQSLFDVTGGQLGSVTSAEVLAGIAAEILLQDAADIDRHLNEYVFPPISKANFPSDSPPVKVVTTGLDQDNRAALTEIIKALIGQHPDAQFFDLRAAMARLEFPLKSEAQVAEEQAKAKAAEEQKAAAEAEKQKAAMELLKQQQAGQSETPAGQVENPPDKQPVGADITDEGKVVADGSPLKPWPDKDVPVADPDLNAAVLWWRDFAPAGAKGLLDAASEDGLSAEDNGIDLGGPGSGNWAHVGRKGQVGGSATRNAGMTIAKGQDWLERYEKAAGKPHPLAVEIAQGKQGTKAERIKEIEGELVTIEQRIVAIAAERLALKKQYTEKQINVLQYQKAAAELTREEEDLNKLYTDLQDELKKVTDEAEPEPEPEPEPTPKELDRSKQAPAGTPVSVALDGPKSGKYAPIYQEALAAIDAVHGDGNLPTIPLKTVSKSSYFGAFRSNYHGPVDITILGKGDHHQTTLAHEVGHFLDHSGMSKKAFLSEVALHDHNVMPGADTMIGKMKVVMQAISSSSAIQRLIDMRKNPDNYKSQGEYTGYGGQKKTYAITVDSSHVAYLLKGREMWARAYAQYIATRSGNTAMLKQVEDTRGDKLYGARQWSDEDFAPIAAAIDELFEFAGWRK